MHTYMAFLFFLPVCAVLFKCSREAPETWCCSPLFHFHSNIVFFSFFPSSPFFLVAASVWWGRTEWSSSSTSTSTETMKTCRGIVVWAFKLYHQKGNHIWKYTFHPTDNAVWHHPAWQNMTEAPGKWFTVYSYSWHSAVWHSKSHLSIHGWEKMGAATLPGHVWPNKWVTFLL